MVARRIAAVGFVAGLAASSLPFGGEVLLSSYWYDWHHNALTRKAAEQAGFIRMMKPLEKPKEDEIDSAAAEIGWHASFIDSYAYNPLFWATRGPQGYTTAVALHDELIKLHYDDTNSTPQLRQTIFRYTTGTITGLLWAKGIYDRGERTRGIAAARQILGVSLHATQDMYSHSNWIDQPTRRTVTWFDKFTADRPGLVNTQFYTGAYEHPEQVSVHSHGIMSPSMSAMQAIAPMMDLLSSDISPVRESATFTTWRKYKNRSEAILPGIIDSTAFGNSGAAQNEAGLALESLTARPSQLYIGMPPNTLFVAPPGMAIDASYLAAIACRERGIVDTTPVRAFIAAYTVSLNASTQWLKRIDQVMKDQLSVGNSFWTDVKTAPPTNQHHAQYEDFNNLGFMFLSAGKYPEDAAATQASLGNRPNAGPPIEYFLRLKLKTSSEILSGTDADIYAEVDGKRFLLDYGNVSTKGFADAIFAYNDFEAGMTTTYTIGPLSAVPTKVRLVNEAGNVGQVLTAVGNSIVSGFTSIAVAISDFFGMIIGAKPDYIGEKRKVWSADQLAQITSAGYEEKLYINGGEEGKYDLFVHIQKLSSNNGQSTFRITPKRFFCIKESTFDQIGSPPGDEVFLCNVVTGFPGTPTGGRTAVFQQTRTDGTKQIPANISYDVTVPDRYGAITYGAMLMESDSENGPARDKIQSEYQGKLDLDSAKKTSILNEVGRAIAADWKLESVEISGFARGGSMGGGVMFAGIENRWIDGNKYLDIPLTQGGIPSLFGDPLHLQTVDPVSNPTNPTEPPAPPSTTIGKLDPINPRPTVERANPKPNEPAAPGQPKDEPFDLGKILLVDDNFDTNNRNSATTLGLTEADKMFRDVLEKEGLKFDVMVAPYQGDGPTLEKMGEYDTIIWYTGSGTQQELSANDRSSVRAWVASGKRNFYLFAPGFIDFLTYDSNARSYKDRWEKCDNSLITKLFGLKGASLISTGVEGDVFDVDNNDLYMVAKGAVTLTRFSTLNPAEGTRVLLRYESEPYFRASGKGWQAVATVARSGSSYCTYIAIALENMLVNRQKLFHKFLYARP